MSEMIERVGKAILAKVPTGYGMTKAEAAEYARVAIEAMREPTEIMVIVGQGNDLGGNPYPVDYAEIWRDMIDSALDPFTYADLMAQLADEEGSPSRRNAPGR